MQAAGKYRQEGKNYVVQDGDVSPPPLLLALPRTQTHWPELLISLQKKLSFPYSHCAEQSLERDQNFA